ncbi:MAG: hypothetical protein ABIB93_00875 [Chloroflexota bacterium]
MNKKITYFSEGGKCSRIVVILTGKKRGRRIREYHIISTHQTSYNGVACITGLSFVISVSPSLEESTNHHIKVHRGRKTGRINCIRVISARRRSISGSFSAG